MSSGPDYDRRVATHLAELQEVLKIPRARYAKAIEVGEGQVSKRFNGKVKCPLGDVLKILGVMKINAKEFFAGVIGEFHAELYLARLELKFTGQVKYGKYDLLGESPSRHYQPEELREAAEALQELRHVDVEAARAQALDILRMDYHYRPSGDPRTQVLARVALAAIFRCEGYYGRTAFFLRTALRLAGSEGSLRGKVRQAIMSLACDQGNFEEALAAVETAISEYARVGNLHGQGRALVSLGIFYGRSGEYRSAIEAYNRALALLPEEEWYGRFYAFQGLGVATIYLSCHQEEALSFLQSALKELESKDVPFLRSWALWLRGEILLWPTPNDALRDFEVVRNTYLAAKTAPLYPALISLRIAKVYLLLERRDELKTLIEENYSLLATIRRSNKLLAGIFRQFLSLGLREELTTEILEHLYRKMHEDAAHAPPIISCLDPANLPGSIGIAKGS